jgi:GTPase SAR1 family protein
MDNVLPYYQEMYEKVNKDRGENFSRNVDIMSTIDFILFKMEIDKTESTIMFLYDKTLDTYITIQQEISKKWQSFDRDTQVILIAIDKKAVIITDEISKNKNTELTEKLLPTLLILTIKSMYYII